MMGVIASRKEGLWVTEQLAYYNNRHFLDANGVMDLTTNVKFVSEKMSKQGFAQNGEEQDYKDLHVFPVDYFCPKQTTGEYFRTENTYCEHMGVSSWAEQNDSWKIKVGKLIGPKNMIQLIKIKRKLFG